MSRDRSRSLPGPVEASGHAVDLLFSILSLLARLPERKYISHELRSTLLLVDIRCLTSNNCHVDVADVHRMFCLRVATVRTPTTHFIKTKHDGD